MAYQNDDLLAFRQLRAQAARKKQLETQRAALTDRCQVLSVQAEACRKARQAAEQEVATLESKGPMGLLYPSAGDKAKRLDEARQTLRKAQADDQQASWDLAQAQVDLAQTERSLEPLAGCDSAFAAARQARATTLQAADLPQSRQLRILEEALAQGEDWFQRLTDLCAQCRTVLDAARQTLRLAERVEQFRTPSTLALLQDAADLTVQQQQKLDQNLTALLTGMEERQTQLEQTLDDLLAQDLFPSPVEEAFPD